jgi:signal transduction histidine kinase
MSFRKKFARQPRALIVAEMAATLFVIAAFDFVSFQFHGGLPNWDDQAAMHLYRIAQEAINNATRHGKARNILVFLEAADHSTSLRVLDDGVGVFESCSEGMGLRIMRYRAQSIGGEVTIERRNGHGTTVSCTVRTNSQVNEIAAA